MLDFLDSLTFSRLRVIARAEDDLLLPAFKGATLRGAFGHTLRGMMCVTRGGGCGDCLVRNSCLYLFLFESPVSDGVRFTGDSAPHPFVLEPSLDPLRMIRKGACFSFAFILIGTRAGGSLPYVLYAFEMLGDNGLGRDRGRFGVVKVEDLLDSGRVCFDGETRKLMGEARLFDSARDISPAPGGRIGIRFLTPARMKERGRLVTPESFSVRTFFSQLHNRLFNLALFHGSAGNDRHGGAGDDRRWKEEMEPLLRQPVIVESDLRWQDWERYSGRSKEHMNMGGLMGSVVFGDVPPELWRLIVLGEHLHIGKASSFGDGKYCIET